MDVILQVAQSPEGWPLANLSIVQQPMNAPREQVCRATLQVADALVGKAAQAT
jgi:hypothetical protein